MRRLAPTNDTVTHNYRLVNSGSDFMRTSGAQASSQATLHIPDQVAGATARRLMFTLQMNGNDAYAWSPSDAVSVNGTAFAIPKPVSNAQPALPPEALVSGILPYSIVIELPDGVLRQGANQISFATEASAVLNIHAELDFNTASAPAFTQPTQALAGAQMPSMPAIARTRRSHRSAIQRSKPTLTTCATRRISTQWCAG